MPASDQEMLKKAIAGDEDALTRLLEQHGPVVHRGLVGRISDRWRSVLSEDDVMQQTYADAFVDIGRFAPRDEGSFAGWLSTMANRNLLDAIRMLKADKRGGDRQRIEPQMMDDSFMSLYEMLGGSYTTPSQDAARKEARSAIGRAVQHLPDNYRRVVQMYDLEGRPLEEVAKALDRSCGAVSMLRIRAHRRLAELMGTMSKFLSGSR